MCMQVIRLCEEARHCQVTSFCSLYVDTSCQDFGLFKLSSLALTNICSFNGIPNRLNFASYQ